MNTEARIAQAERRVEGYWRELGRALVDWIRGGTESEQAATWRWLYAQGELSADFTIEQLNELMAGRLECHPKDEAIAQAFLARMPDELATRWHRWRHDDDE